MNRSPRHTCLGGIAHCRDQHSGVLRDVWTRHTAGAQPERGLKTITEEPVKERDSEGVSVAYYGERRLSRPEGREQAQDA